MQPAELLELLHKVRKTGTGRWMACCPAHDDKSPSLSITERQDGKILLHCFASCGIDEIVGALGLEVSDLWPERLVHSEGQQPKFLAFEVLMALSHETNTAALITIKASEGRATEADVARLMLAAGRISEAARLVEGVTSWTR